MVLARGGGAAEALAEIGEEQAAERGKARVRDGVEALLDEGKVGGLPGAQRGRAAEQVFALVAA